MRVRALGLNPGNSDEGTSIDVTSAGAGDLLAVFYLCSLQAANNGINGSAQRIAAFAVRDGASGIKQHCVQVSEQNNVATTVNASLHSNNRFIKEQRNGVLTSEFEITDWITDGMRVFIHSTDGTRRNTLFGIFDEPDNADIKAIDIGFHNLVAGAQSVAVGFQPDWLLLASGNLAVDDGVGINGEFTQGMACNAEVVGQGSVGHNCPGGLSTVSIAAVVSNDKALYLPTFAGALGWTADIETFTATGFNINGTEGGLTLGVQMLWFAVQYADNEKPKMTLIDHTLPNALGVETVSAEIEPVHMFWLSMESVPGYNAPATTGIMSQCVHTQMHASNGPYGSVMRNSSTTMLAGATTSVAQCRQNSANIIFLPSDGSADSRRADNDGGVLFTPDGWSWDWTTMLATTEVNLGVAMVIGYPTKLYKGGDQVQEMYIGGDKVVAAYKGSERVY